jgi:hypothetical protein
MNAIKINVKNHQRGLFRGADLGHYNTADVCGIIAFSPGV